MKRIGFKYILTTMLLSSVGLSVPAAVRTVDLNMTDGERVWFPLEDRFSLGFADDCVYVSTMRGQYQFELEDIRTISYGLADNDDVSTDIKTVELGREIELTEEGLELRFDKPIKVQVFDSVGRTVYTSIATGELTLSFPDLPSGILVVVIDGKSVLKIINP